ncbi:MAG: hypothetical protein ACRCX8_06655 [Sarcina sp.]
MLEKLKKENELLLKQREMILEMLCEKNEEVKKLSELNQKLINEKVL